MGWTILLCVLALLALALLLPVRLLIRYEDEQLALTMRYGFFSLRLLPAKPEKKPKKPKKAKAKKQKPEKAEKPEKKAKNPLTGQSMLDYVHMAQELLPVLGRQLGFLMRHVKLDKLMLAISVAGQDAAQTAILYGKLSGAVYSLLAIAQNICMVSPPQGVQITADFAHYHSSLQARLRVSLSVWVAVAAALRLAIAVFRTVILPSRNPSPACTPT